MTDYELNSLNLPKLTGTGLIFFTAAVENPFTRALLLGSLLENGGILKLRQLDLEEIPTLYPLAIPERGTNVEGSAFTPDTTPLPVPYRTVRDYADAYQARTLDPLQVAERVLKAIDASEEGQFPLRSFVAINPQDILAQAQASKERIEAGRPLSILDGVPVAVKDEVDMKPYPTKVGTCFLGTEPASEDAIVVARLRKAGALLVGKTTMHEIGINPNGFNFTHGAVRNPCNVRMDPGGSSCGSAAAVAAGLVPLAVGADGGGSIRIPASLCGIVGLKPTFGRLPETGAAPLCWSVAHLGPLAASVEDTALAYSLMAGPDSREPNSCVQPPVTLAGWNQTDLRGVRLGIYREWFDHSSPEVVKISYEMVEQFKSAGAEIVEIEIPGLDEMRIAHATTILAEMAICMKPYRSQRKKHGYAVRLSLVLGEAFTASDYLQAQRIRTKAMATFRNIFQNVDAIISPATALAAQPIPENGLKTGWSDLGTDTEMMRYVFPGNLTGLPAISFPVGYDQRGLPVGMQAMGRHWEENLLLRVAYNAERLLKRNLPERYFRIF